MRVLTAVLVSSFLVSLAEAQDVKTLQKSALDKKKAGDLAGAEADLTEILRLDPSSVRAQYERARVRYLQERDKEAISDFTAVIEKRPSRVAYFGRGRSRIEAGDYKGAESDFSECLRRRRTAGAHYWRAQARYMLHFVEGGDPNPSLADLNASIRLKPTGRAHALRGHLIELGEGDFDRARKDYETAIELGNTEALINRGDLERREGNRAAALRSYAAALKHAPKVYHPIAHLNRSIVYSDIGDDRRALQELDEAIRLDPDYAHAYNERAKIRSYLGDKAGAERDRARARALRAPLIRRDVRGVLHHLERP